MRDYIYIVELLGVMRGVLEAIKSGINEAYIVHDNENVIWYLTGEYKKDWIIECTYDIESTKDDWNFNKVYFLFFRELFKADIIKLRFIHVYSHVRPKDDKDKDNEENSYWVQDDKPIKLENNDIFIGHPLFEGNYKADKLADKALKGEL